VFEWLFKYTRAEYTRGELLLSSDWPLSWLIAAMLVGGCAVAALAWYRGRALGWLRLGGMVLLQWAMLGLVLVELWQPALLLKTLRAGENAVALLLDDSASMALRDPLLSRMAQAQMVLADPALTALTDEFKPRRYRFDSDAESIDSFVDAAPSGRATAIGDSVLQVLRALQSTPLGAVVLVSDGADNAGTLDPEQLTAIASYGVPVQVIGVGRETIPEDLELEQVLVPEKTLPGTTLAARVAIRHDGAGVARIKAYDGQHFLASQDVTLPANATLTNAYLNFELADSGYRELKFSIDAKQGEPTLANNARTRVVPVAGRKAKVLYVEGEPRWELKFMRRALEHDSGVRLMSWLHTSPNGYYRQGVELPDELQGGFPADRPALFKYDAIVIGSVAAAAFKPAQLQLLRDFVSERGGSLLMLAGPHGLGDGGWGETQVGKLLPAQLPASKSGFQRVQAQALLTARGRRSTTLKLADDALSNEQQWSALPKLADYQSLGSLRPAAVALLNLRVGDREQPLLVTQPFGRGHSWILASGGTWRWQMLLPPADQRHEQFWRQLMRGLVAEVPEAFSVQAHAVGDKLVVRVDAHDESFAPLRDVAISAVASLGGEAIAIPLQPLTDQAGVYRGEASVAGSGTYFVDAVAQRGGKEVGKGRTVVQFSNGDAENFGLRQNRALLTQLARATGGSYWEPTKLAGLPDAVRASTAGVTRQELKPVWDAPMVFLTLLALKCGEWLLRRRWGVV
jgi:uncharacterized membrane protein